MSDLYSPDNILAALITIEDELIALIGSKWSSLEVRYQDLRQQLNDENSKWLASVEMVELFAPFDDVRELLNRAILGQDLHSAVMLGLADLAEQIGFDSALFVDAAQPRSPTRLIIMKAPTKAKTVKLGNIEFDFGEMGELVAGVIMTSNDIAGDFSTKSHILMAAGILLIASSLYKTLTIKLTEREATVFYGFAQAAGKDKTALESTIREKANAIRREVGLKSLDVDEVHAALYKLKELKSVESVEGGSETWRIIEKYHSRK